MDGLRALWHGAVAGGPPSPPPGALDPTGASSSADADAVPGVGDESDYEDYLPPNAGDDDDEDEDDGEGMDYAEGDTNLWESMRRIAEAPLYSLGASSSLSSSALPSAPMVDPDIATSLLHASSTSSSSSNGASEAALLEALSSNEKLRSHLRTLLSDVEVALSVTQDAQYHLTSAVTDEFRSQLAHRTDAHINRAAGGPPFFVGSDGSTPQPHADVTAVRQARVPRSHVPSARWTPEDCERLARGVRQQNQLLRLAAITKRTAALEQRFPDAATRFAQPEHAELRAEFERVQQMPPEALEENIDGIDWARIPPRFLPERTADECRLHWVNLQHPRISRAPWTPSEDADLARLASLHKERSWSLIASELGTNRTALQCLQRHRIKHGGVRTRWTVQEDLSLREAVRRFGERNWQQVANALEGRSGQACLHRWLKALHPSIVRGRWGAEEDARLREAVQLYGLHNWVKVQSHVRGRTDMQCRERWMNVLDPAIDNGPFSAEEDARLLMLVERYGPGKWAEISKEMPKRTDNILWRRWKSLMRKSQRQYADYIVTKHSIPQPGRTTRHEVKYTQPLSGASALKTSVKANLEIPVQLEPGTVISQTFLALPPTSTTANAFERLMNMAGYGGRTVATTPAAPSTPEAALYASRFQALFLWPGILTTVPHTPSSTGGDDDDGFETDSDDDAFDGEEPEVIPTSKRPRRR